MNDVKEYFKYQLFQSFYLFGKYLVIYGLFLFVLVLVYKVIKKVVTRNIVGKPGWDSTGHAGDPDNADYPRDKE